MRLLCSLALLFPAAGYAQTTEDPTTVVIVIVGDPAPALVTAAQDLEALISRWPDLRMPIDPELRRALIGEPPNENADGLSQARELRRLLGWNDDRDDRILARVALVVDARAALVLRAEDGAPQLEIFSRDAGRFFEQRLALRGATPAEITRFIRLRLAVPEPRAPEPAPPSAPALTPADSPEPAARAPWLRQNWAYLVGGVLLAGVVSYAVWRRQEEPLGPPLVLRIVPEGAP